jgi:hypothetical protein
MWWQVIANIVDITQWFIPGVIVAIVTLVVAIWAGVGSWRAARSRPPITIQADLEDQENNGWHRCRLTIRNEIPSATLVISVRCKKPSGMMLALGADWGRLPIIDLATFSVCLLPAWEIGAATDRWSDLVRDIFILRPASLWLRRNPRQLVLELSFVLQDGARRTIILSVTTKAIIWN